jgi:hypothetical protein
MKDHMKFLFEAFDTDNSNGIDQKELYTAMKMLGQRCSQSHVKTIFNDIDLDGSAYPQICSLAARQALMTVCRWSNRLPRVHRGYGGPVERVEPR